ncbi:MAG: hypothetical protein AAGA81_12450 [Acidobacteriota bacterium]
MKQTLVVWLVLAVIYGVFFGWYTSFGGPLTEEEITKYLEQLEQNETPPEGLELMRRFMEEDTGGDFAMLNIIHYYDTPLQIGGVEPGETSRQVMNKYMQYMTPALFARACHPVFLGTAAAPAADIMNAEGMEIWSSGALMRYRSRRDLLNITTNPEFFGSHEFKVAAMQKTIAFPVDPWFHFGDPRLLLAFVLTIVGTLLSWALAHRSTRSQSR